MEGRRVNLFIDLFLVNFYRKIKFLNCLLLGEIRLMILYSFSSLFLFSRHLGKKSLRNIMKCNNIDNIEYIKRNRGSFKH